MLILYTTEDGKSQIQLRARDQTVWLSQREMGELFDTSTDNISLHLKNIFEDEELRREATTEESSVVQVVENHLTVTGGSLGNCLRSMRNVPAWTVIPAKAGSQIASADAGQGLDSCFRGNDRLRLAFRRNDERWLARWAVDQAGASMSKKIIIIAGPNGAGKTTFARSFLPAEAQCPRFINADLIAAGLAPFAPETAAIKAGRLMLREIAECVQRSESFALETTLAGLGYLMQIKAWRAAGYRVSLFFLSLPAAEDAIARVAVRVRQGGHDIPEAVIRRRFDAGLRNFETIYKFAVDDWALYDNRGDSPILLEWGENP